MKVIEKEKNMKDVRESKKEKNIIKVRLETSSNVNMNKVVNGGKKKHKNKVVSSEKSLFARSFCLFSSVDSESYVVFCLCGNAVIYLALLS